MKLTDILKESQHLSYKRMNVGEEKEEKRMTNEEKREFLKAVSEYKKFGESIYRSANLAEVHESIKNLVETAHKVTLEETGDWFDKVTVNRHMKSMNESFKVFEKTIQEVNTLQQRLESCYDEMGEVLGKYYDIKEGNEFGAARAKAIAKGEDEFEVGGKKFPVKDVDKDDKENAKKFAKESVNEAQKVNPTSKKFLKGMKKIKVKGLGGYMPGVDYVYVDGDKYYFVDFEGDHMELKNISTIKQLHKLHGKSLGESVNESNLSPRFVVKLQKGLKSVLGTDVEYDVNSNDAYEFFIDGDSQPMYMIGVGDGADRKAEYSFDIYDDGAMKTLASGTADNEKDLLKQVLSSAKKNKKYLLQTESIKLMDLLSEKDDAGTHLDRLADLVGNASSLMNVGKELKKAKYKYDFSTGMMPMYIINVDGHKFGIVNKKYVDKGDREVGDIAIGLMENLRTEGKDDFVARSGKADIFLKKGYKHHNEDELSDLYSKLGKLVKGLNVKKVDLVFEGEDVVLEGASSEEKRIVMLAVRKIAKYRNVDIKTAALDVMRAAQELERDIEKGKVKK